MRVFLGSLGLEESWYCGSPIFALRHALDVFFWKPCKYCKNSVYCCKDLWGSSRPRNRTEASCIAVRERASERWTGSAGEDGNVPRFGGRAEAPGDWAPGPVQWTTDGQPGRPVQDRLPRSHAPPRRAACETPQKLRAVRSRTLGSSGQRQKRRRVGGRGRNLGLPKPSDPLSSDVAGRSGGRETPERTPRGAGQGGAGWATLVMECVVGGVPGGDGGLEGPTGQGPAWSRLPTRPPFHAAPHFLGLLFPDTGKTAWAGPLPPPRSVPEQTEVSLLSILRLALVTKCS
ncbi:mitochondrial inner membrane protease subunit 1 isoform X2 [Bubalus bubalis]|uniref:mitochondrial inner membrane protease subunit 1 isoform X2 n=1 Tax=Bubalus bubalis TaxID=89462 RepID=UPI001E1B7E03|nr:mitochondrial inner membrane protease subunit 1 isoform X2 [Bubalus bubalis]